uniref:Putative ovule protein n=1 Tax=Solanum chacoense TaxID=4108 RepID=A0A0V0GUD0_SOLCH
MFWSLILKFSLSGGQKEKMCILIYGFTLALHYWSNIISNTVTTTRRHQLKVSTMVTVVRVILIMQADKHAHVCIWPFNHS